MFVNTSLVSNVRIFLIASFIELFGLKNAGLESPFDEKCLRGVCETASKWLSGVDMTGIE